MGGIVGRLFREFAMTVAIAVMVSAVVSLTLTPMMCARFLKPSRHEAAWPCLPHCRAVLRCPAERVSPDARYRAAVPIHRPLWCSSARWPSPSISLCCDSERLPSHPRTLACMLGITEGGPGRFVWGNGPAAGTGAADIVAADPAVQAVSSSIGAGLGGQTGNNGRLWITLKPFDQRDVTVAASHRPPAHEDGQDRRHERLFPSGPGHQRGRPTGSHAVSIHPPGRQSG